MVQTAADIQREMDVYTTDGTRIGKVGEVWPQVEDGATGITANGFFQVHEGGVLGLGGKDLFIPFGAVDDLIAGESVTLSCSKEECEQQYGQKPNFLT